MGALAVLTGEPQLCRDGFAEVVVPLVHEGCVIGLVTAGCPRPGAFDETDLHLLGMLSALASHRLVLALSHEQGAVIDLAHAHELIVVAEGVETTMQLEVLRTMGCDRAQGYLMGRPMTPEQLEDLVRSDPRW